MDDDPLSTPAIWNLALVHYVARRRSGIAEEIDRALERDPSSFLLHVARGWAFSAEGQSEQAVASFEKALEVSGRHQWVLGWLAEELIPSGHRDRVRRIQTELEAKHRAGTATPFSLAVTAALLGEREKALEYIELGVEENDFAIVFAPRWPAFESLWGEPRFQATLRRAGIAW